MRGDLVASFTLSDGALDALAEAIAQRLASVLAPSTTHWLAGAQEAADYLGWPKARVDRNIRQIPHRRHGNRLMFRRDELDAWLDGFYEGPPRLELGQVSATKLLSRRSRSVPHDGDGA